MFKTREIDAQWEGCDCNLYPTVRMLSPKLYLGIKLSFPNKRKEMD